MNIEKKEIKTESIVYKPSSPFLATVLENNRITPNNATSDVHHLVFDISGSNINYLEGQSIGVVPPGTDESGKNHRVRLYSISSPREGEKILNSVALTVKRVIFSDSDNKEIKGVASNYICDLKKGDKVNITGPVGRTFMLPEDDQTDIIMVAVGTGIAPFRAFIKYMYEVKKGWKGKVLLFYGTKTALDALYMNDENNDIGQYYDQKTFLAFTALSQEGKKEYIQEKIKDNRTLIWNILMENNFMFYICGIKGMEEGIEAIMKDLASSRGQNWDELRSRYKAEHKWHLEVY